ncbi:MAG: TetR/AcrR family transcriptional regulator [Bacteriovoracaceae bacterium]
MLENALEKLTKGQKTAQKILEAAARCISKVGVEKTSVTNIAKEAELKRSLIAYHYPKKAEIFYKVIISITQSIVEQRSANTENLKGREKLQQILLSYTDFFYQNTHYFNCYLHFFYMSSIDEKYRKLNDQITNNSLDVLKEAIREIFDMEKMPLNEKAMNDFAELLYQRLIGVIMRYFSTNHNFSTEQYRKQYVDLLNSEIDLFISYSKSRVK